MLEHHLKSAVTQQRLRSGPAADHIDDFADWLHRRGVHHRLGGALFEGGGWLYPDSAGTRTNRLPIRAIGILLTE